MKQVRIALLGVNHPHSLSHLKTLQHSSLVSDVVVYDTDEVAVERVVEEAGNKVVEGSSDLEYVLNESGAVAELEGAKAVAGIDNGGGGDCEEEDYGLRAVERGVEGGSGVIDEGVANTHGELPNREVAGIVDERGDESFPDKDIDDTDDERAAEHDAEADKEGDVGKRAER